MARVLTVLLPLRSIRRSSRDWYRMRRERGAWLGTTPFSPAVEIANPSTPQSSTASMAPGNKKVIAKLTALFSLDAFGGGFLTDALVAYWFFRRFGIGEQSLGLVFFAVHVLNAVSHLGAAWLARRIGLVNTMVFTHLPSSLFLMAVPFAPSFKWAVLLLLCREALVEMDVPTRQSYVAALVQTSERTFASGITNLARNLLWAMAREWRAL